MRELGKGGQNLIVSSKFEVKTAILVDGGFYRVRAKALAGNKTPKERADELERYCFCLLYTSRCV